MLKNKPKRVRYSIEDPMEYEKAQEIVAELRGINIEASIGAGGILVRIFPEQKEEMNAICLKHCVDAFRGTTAKEIDVTGFDEGIV
jgi:hypothetical protein